MTDFSRDRNTIPLKGIQRRRGKKTPVCMDQTVLILLSVLLTGFPGGRVVKESACQCRRGGFDPWVENIPWRRKRQLPTFLPAKSHAEEPGRLQSIKLQRVGRDLVTKQQKCIFNTTTVRAFNVCNAVNQIQPVGWYFETMWKAQCDVQNFSTFHQFQLEQ